MKLLTVVTTSLAPDARTGVDVDLQAKKATEVATTQLEL